MILDTAFLIDLMNGDEDAVDKAAELEATGTPQRLSSMTFFELQYGVVRAVDSETEQEKIEAVVSSRPIHPADAAVMRKAGRLAGQLQNDGIPVEDSDVMTGATGSVVDEPVLTRNVDDFERLGVNVRRY